MAKQRKKLTEDEVLAIVANEMSIANITTSSPTMLRDPLLYYLGLPNGTEIEGRSSLVSTDVADAIEWIMPQIMKSFTQNNEVVLFDAINEADVEQAAIESEYVYDVLMKQNNGFVLIHQFVKDALMQRNGVLKVYYKDDDEVKTYKYTGLNDDQLNMIIADQNTELVTLTTEQYIDQLSGEVANSHDVKIKVTRKCGRIVIDPVAPEEFRVNTQHNSIDLTDARFTCHILNKSLSDLREEGVSEDKLEGLMSSDLIRTSYRFSYQNEPTIIPSTLQQDDANKLVEICEVFMPIDLDGDGISEYTKITVAGAQPPVKILDVEDLDSSPWISCTAILMSHKFQGLSIYDRLKSIQDNKTAIIRNLMDNMYLQNNQRNIVLEGAVNLDDMMVSRPGGLIRAKRMDAIQPLQTPQIGPAAFDLMRYLDEIKAGRTGVSADGTASPQNIGDRVGSQGVDRMMNAKEELVGLIIRVICETGIKPLCNKIRDLATKHIDSIEDFEFKGQWVKVNPSQWPTRSKSTVRVGTGTGDVSAKLAALEKINALQQAIVAQPGQTLCNQDKAYAVLDDMCKLSGLNGASRYFVDPKSQEGQQAKQQSGQQQQEAKKKEEMIQMLQAQLQMATSKAEAEIAKSAVMTAEAQQGNVTLKGQVEMAKHQRETERQQMQLEIESLKAKLNSTKMESDTISKNADLEFKREQLNKTIAVELAKLDSADTQPVDTSSIDQAKIDSQIAITKMKIESDEKIKAMEIAADIELAIINSETKEANEPDKEASESSEESNIPTEPHPAIMDALKSLQDTHGQTQAILQAINKPKKIIRGADGRPEGIE